ATRTARSRGTGTLRFTSESAKQRYLSQFADAACRCNEGCRKDGLFSARLGSGTTNRRYAWRGAPAAIASTASRAPYNPRIAPLAAYFTWPGIPAERDTLHYRRNSCVVSEQTGRLFGTSARTLAGA